MANWDFCDECNGGAHCERHFPERYARAPDPEVKPVAAVAAQDRLTPSQRTFVESQRPLIDIGDGDSPAWLKIIDQLAPKPQPAPADDVFTAFERLADELVDHDRAVQSGAKPEGVFNDGRTAAFKIRELVKRVRAEGGAK